MLSIQWISSEHAPVKRHWEGLDPGYTDCSSICGLFSVKPWAPTVCQAVAHRGSCSQEANRAVKGTDVKREQSFQNSTVKGQARDTAETARAWADGNELLEPWWGFKDYGGRVSVHREQSKKKLKILKYNAFQEKILTIARAVGRNSGKRGLLCQ